VCLAGGLALLSAAQSLWLVVRVSGLLGVSPSWTANVLVIGGGLLFVEAIRQVLARSGRSASPGAPAELERPPSCR
jgi:hypothetical protein